MRRNLSILFLGTSALAGAASNAESFSDLYAEGVYLGDVRTAAGLANFRSGVRPQDKVETYGVGRIGGDSRTHLEKTDAVYNDNFLFLGAGFDYLGLVNGVRFTAQLGYSIDLNKKIHKQGFDLRAGFMTYHENKWPCENCLQEIYSEALYVKRYENFIADLQWRIFLSMWSTQVAGNDSELGPLLNTVVAIDSRGYDYNRFVEMRFGARWKLHNDYNVAVNPMFVVGDRWAGARSEYSEFRCLVTAYAAF